MTFVECTQCRRENPQGPVREAKWLVGSMHICNYHHDMGWPEDVIKRQQVRGRLYTLSLIILVALLVAVVVLAMALMLGSGHMAY